MRLIDADALLLAINEDYHDPKIDILIQRAPTIDPVKHGRWVFRKGWDSFVCSECSYENGNYSHYCPNCGARMDGTR